MAFRVGKLPYLHSEPFYFDMERRGIELVTLVPTELTKAAEAGDIDAGPLALVDAFRLEDQFDAVSGFCVATMGRSQSSFLYSKVPIEELAGAQIGVIDETCTSIKLLQVLLQQKYQVEPANYVGLQDPNDAMLLMGNRGLRQRRGARGYPHAYDLGTEWGTWTGLPFVFARWVARKGSDHQELALLEDTLYVGLEEGVDALYHTSEPREALLMLPRDVVDYVQGLRYFIGMSEQKSIDLFREKLANLEG
ncbi:MAG: menaquinone biosynthesis protein [Dehalococcoidia bacterium]